MLWSICWTFLKDRIEPLSKTSKTTWINATFKKIPKPYFFRFHSLTDSTKINRPVHSIRMYWTNFLQPTAHVQQNIFGKTLIEVRSPHLYASFGTFYAKIGPLFEAQWVFKECLKIEGKCRRFRNSSECLKTHCGANNCNWPIWTQKVPKEA